VNQREIQQHLGSVIRRRRKQLELRQQDLAAQLGISRGSLANIEIGKQGVLVHQLYSFAEALGLRPEDFLAPLPDKTNPLQEPWAEAIPADLKLEQRKQIARLIGDQREPQKGE
jgi:transcriptional regulator with XRE-family HTH domain